MPVSYNVLLPKDRQTVNHVYHYVHPLPFDVRSQENAVDLDLLEPVVDLLYEKHSTHHQYLVAYKGGHVDKDLLTKLKIPHVDLEFYGCPKSNKLLCKGAQPIPNCGHQMHAHTHCPKVECVLYGEWLTDHF